MRNRPGNLGQMRSENSYLKKKEVGWTAIKLSDLKYASARRDDFHLQLRAPPVASRLRELGKQKHFEVRIFLLFPHPLQERVEAWEMDIKRLTDAAYLRDIQALQIPKDLHPNKAGHERLSSLLEK